MTDPLSKLVNSDGIGIWLADSLQGVRVHTPALWQMMTYGKVFSFFTLIRFTRSLVLALDFLTTGYTGHQRHRGWLHSKGVNLHVITVGALDKLQFRCSLQAPEITNKTKIYKTKIHYICLKKPSFIICQKRLGSNSTTAHFISRNKHT